MSRMRFFVLPVFLALCASWANAAPAPIAPQHDHQIVSPNGTRTDSYFWLRDDTRKLPEMLTLLDAENHYYQQESAPYAKLTEKLNAEIIGRIKQDDSTVPYRKGHYRYYARFTKGGQYPIHARRAVAGGTEQILVDANLEGRGKNYYAVDGLAISHNEQLLAYLEDTSGRRQFTLKFRDLKSGKDLPDQIPGLAPQVAWANDNKTVFYVENDPVTLLTTRIKKHVLGTSSTTDAVVYTEADHSYYLELRKSGDERFIVIDLTSTTTGEVLTIDADHPEQVPAALAPRAPDIKYQADHIDGRWIILTDWLAPNFRVMAVDDNAIGSRDRWHEVVAHDSNIFIQNLALFKHYLVLNERSDGLLRLHLMPWGAADKSSFIKSDEAAYSATLSVNAEQDTDVLRYSYTSLTTPPRIYAADMQTGRRTLLKQREVPGGFKSEHYVTERVWARARDGSRIPVSLVYRKGLKRDGSAPLYQYAYGAYGVSSDPEFKASLVTLLDRGFVYAIAHIRGGEEMGRAWYENGKLLNKKNSFTDFVDVTDALVAQKYAAKDKVFAMGRSAGGLLMGAVANMAGTHYAGIIAHVPFVDVVTTMLDESIPLTTNEFDEWGNPKEKAWYDYMLSYSPYDNVAHQAYPAMLVTTGLHDSQVQYYEPAKWVAKLRATKTDTNPLYFKVNMEAGHGGKSGRFAQVHEIAEEYAFVLHQLGMTQ